MSNQGSVNAELMEEISHRLRSPLTSLITYLSLMEMRLERATQTGEVRPDLLGYAQLEAAALADAVHMGEELDKLLARHTARGAPASPSTRAPNDTTMGDRRFDRLWDAWDARLAAGVNRLDVVKDLTERELAELLAADAGASRKLERNVIATELTNRLGRRSRPPSDVVVAAMARLIARASHTSADTRRLVADSARTRAQGVQRRAEVEVRRSRQEGDRGAGDP